MNKIVKTKKKFGFWRNLDNQKELMEQVGNKLNIRSLDDWYKINVKQFRIRGGNSILMYYGGSLVDTLFAIYPEHNWDPSKFSNIPKGYWKDKVNQRKHLDQVGQKLNITQLSDWYNYRASDIRKFGGNPILKFYGESTQSTLESVYPEYKWDRRKLVKSEFLKLIGIKRGSMDNITNQKIVLDAFGKLLNVSTYDDWYRVKYRDISNLGGSFLLSSMTIH